MDTREWMMSLRSGDTAAVPSDVLHQVTVGKSNALHITAGLGLLPLSMKVYLDRPALLAEPNSRGDTPLHCAARAGRTLLVGALLDHLDVESGDRYVLMAQNARGNTAVHEAVRNDHADVAIALLFKAPELAAVVNGSGESPLYVAAERGASAKLVEFLLDCEHCNHRGPKGKTALHAAVFRSYNIAELILDKKSEFTTLPDDSQSTPLHYAASTGDTKMVQLLLKHKSSASYLADKDGLSPVHVAAAMGYVDIISQILEYCPDASECTDNKGRSFLHVASEKKRANVVKYVLRMHALGELINEQDQNGDTALHLAVTNHDQEIVQILLADKRVDTKATNYDSQTPRDLASSFDDPNIRLRMKEVVIDLLLARSQLSPKRMDLMMEYMRNRRRSRKETISSFGEMANNLAIVAVLIATVTFAAAFTLPGGYDSNSGPHQGMAILTKQAAFKAFLISDTVAMISAVAVIFLLIYSGSRDHDGRVRGMDAAIKFVLIALLGMVVAFATGTYAVVASDCLWLAIFVCGLTSFVLYFYVIKVFVVSFDSILPLDVIYTLQTSKFRSTCKRALSVVLDPLHPWCGHCRDKVKLFVRCVADRLYKTSEAAV